MLKPTVHCSNKKLNGKIQIKVIDNGNGIQKNMDNKTYEPFFTTIPTEQSTAFGLSLAYDIIKALGGEIRVKTKVEEGGV